MKTEFKNLIKGQWFIFGGAWWWKASTRTARTQNGNAVFYFSGKDLCETQPPKKN